MESAEESLLPRSADDEADLPSLDCAELPPRPFALCCCAEPSNAFCSKEIVFLRPRFVVPGTFGPTIDDVYLMISVSGGRRTPNNDDGSLKEGHGQGIS